MRTNSKVKSIIVLTVFAIFIAPKYTQADEHKWLKSSNYDNIFVYANFSSCAIAENQLTKSLEGVFLSYRMQPYISKDPPVMSVVDDGKFLHFIHHKLVENKKIFFQVCAQCEKYRSGYLYDFDTNFGIVDEHGSILLYALPNHAVFGIGLLDNINTAFRTIVEDAVADYLSANIQKIN